MTEGGSDSGAAGGGEHRGLIVAAALEQAAGRVFERLRETARKRQDWQDSLNDLLRRSGKAEAGGDASVGVAAIPAIEAATARISHHLQSGLTGSCADEAVAAAVREVRGRSARAVIRDYDRLFITARNGLLEHLPAPAEAADQQGGAESAATATGDELEGVIALAERVLKEERGGCAALDRLLHDFVQLLDRLRDAEVRDVAYAVLANLILVLLARLVREFVEELALIAAERPARPANTSEKIAHVVEALRQRVREQKMPGLLPMLRIVTHEGVRASAGRRAGAPTVASISRYQLVVFLEKRKKVVRAWWVDAAGGFRIGWIKAAYLKEL